MTSPNDFENFEELPDQGSFVAGFSLGLIAGAAAYYLFGTEQGSKVRKQLTQDWEKARNHMIQDGVLKDSKISLRGFLQDLVEEIFQTSLPSEIMSPTRSRRSSGRSAAAAKKTKRTSKFSGV